MVWDLSLSLSLGLSSTPPPMGQGEEENTRGMGVFDLGELSLKGATSIYIKCQRFFVTQRKSLFCFNYSCSSLISRAGANAVVCVPLRAS